MVLALLFVLVPMQVNANEGEDVPPVVDATEPEVTEPEVTEPAGDEETPFLEELWAIIVHYWGVVSEWFTGVIHDIYVNIQGQ